MHSLFELAHRIKQKWAFIFLYIKALNSIGFIWEPINFRLLDRVLLYSWKAVYFIFKADDGGTFFESNSIAPTSRKKGTEMKKKTDERREKKVEIIWHGDYSLNFPSAKLE